RRDSRVLEPGRPAADHERAPRVVNPRQRAGAPVALAADLRVVDALDASAADDAPPAVVRGDAAADVLGAPVSRLLRPLRVGEELPREQDRIGLARLEDLLRD